jgi:hypothetical protein
MTDPRQPIIDRLKSQAQAYDPAPPGHLNRRIRTSLAAADAPSQVPLVSLLRWPLTAALLAGVLLAGAAIYRQSRRSPDVAKGKPRNPPATVVHRAAPSPTFASAGLPALTQRWIDQPLQGEVESLLSDLTRTRQTVERVLPAAARRTKPATKAAAPQGA